MAKDASGKVISTPGTERRYDQEAIRLAGQYILCEKVKVTEKQESTEFTASQQVEPYAKSFGKKSYEIQLTGVDHEQKPFFNQLQQEQEKFSGYLEGLPNLQTYDKDPHTGVLRLDYNLLAVGIEEISKENASPFDVKLSALKRKY
jgi:hypothetical protein